MDGITDKERLPRILVTYSDRIPSVDLGTIMPLGELEKRGLCILKHKKESSLSASDLSWSDILYIVRGVSLRSLWAAVQANKFNRKVLEYLDDDLSGIPAYSESHSYLSRPDIQRNIKTILNQADAVFSPSPKLAAKLSTEYNLKAEVLPASIEFEDFDSPELERNEIPVIGYAGSLDGREILNSLIGPALNSAASTGINFKVHIVGPKPDFIGKLNVETIFTPFIPEHAGYIDFSSKLNWDVGLAPQFECEFSSYKFHRKLLEYARIGCPGIYSNVEIYREVIQDGVTGILANNTVEAWKEATLKLLNDPGLRSGILQKTRDYVKNHHNKEIVSRLYADKMAPFLVLRAPEIEGKRVITAELSKFFYEFRRLKADGLYVIKSRGFKSFMEAALRYVFR
jgi:glycosyltransferase involved in cell wall biosynthesis